MINFDYNNLTIYNHFKLNRLNLNSIAESQSQVAESQSQVAGSDKSQSQMTVTPPSTQSVRPRRPIKKKWISRSQRRARQIEIHQAGLMNHFPGRIRSPRKRQLEKRSTNDFIMSSCEVVNASPDSAEDLDLSASESDKDFIDDNTQHSESMQSHDNTTANENNINNDEPSTGSIPNLQQNDLPTQHSESTQSHDNTTANENNVNNDEPSTGSIPSLQQNDLPYKQTKEMTDAMSDFHKHIRSYSMKTCPDCFETWPRRDKETCVTKCQTKKAAKVTIANRMYPFMDTTVANTPLKDAQGRCIQPPELEGLTTVEEMMISRAIPLVRV